MVPIFCLVSLIQIWAEVGAAVEGEVEVNPELVLLFLVLCASVRQNFSKMQSFYPLVRSRSLLNSTSALLKMEKKAVLEMRTDIFKKRPIPKVVANRIVDLPNLSQHQMLSLSLPLNLNRIMTNKIQIIQSLKKNLMRRLRNPSKKLRVLKLRRSLPKYKHDQIILTTSPVLKNISRSRKSLNCKGRISKPNYPRPQSLIQIKFSVSVIEYSSPSKSLILVMTKAMMIRT